MDDVTGKQGIQLAECFLLDEYLNLPESHPASFRKYLKERFLAHVNVKTAHLIDGEADLETELKRLNEEVTRAPIDLALIGIGENAHIAFNDPPADFDNPAPFTVVDLDERCKLQQVREGWFPSIDDVPKQAITMTVQQILRSKNIITVAPHEVKAEAIYNTLNKDVDPMYPATILKTHASWSLYLDKNSASKIVVWS